MACALVSLRLVALGHDIASVRSIGTLHSNSRLCSLLLHHLILHEDCLTSLMSMMAMVAIAAIIVQVQLVVQYVVSV